MDELQAMIATLTAQLDAANANIARLTAAEEQLAALRVQNDALKSQLTEAMTAKDAIVTEAQQLRESAETLNTQLAEATVQLARIAEVEQATAKKTRYEERLTELPEAYVAALAKRTDEEKTRFATKWADASSEEWTEFKNEIAFAFSQIKVSYLDRTLSEGGALSALAAGSEDIATELSAIKR